MESDEGTQKISQMLHGYAKSQAIYVAARLDLAEHLAAGPQSVEALAETTETHAASLFRLLRALASEGIFKEVSPRTFALTPAAECLRAGARNSQRAMALMMGEEHYQAWAELLYTVQTGEKGFDKVYGEPIFEYMSKNPRTAEIFDAAMSSIHGREALPMLQAYDFSGFKKVADIGGGNGSTLIALLEKYPEAEGILFDLEHVIKRSQANIKSAGLESRCECVDGDFFSAIPEGADLYLFRHIIHDWNDEQCVTILSNCRKVLKPQGKLLILESVIEPGNDPSFAKWLDLTMMVIPGGKERTQEEYRELLAKAGLKLTRILPTPGQIDIVEAELE